jgi:hypothetical protein
MQYACQTRQECEMLKKPCMSEPPGLPPVLQNGFAINSPSLA